MLRRGKTALFLAAMVVCVMTAFSSAAGKKSLAIFNFRPTNIEAMRYSGDILYGLISLLGMEGSVDLMPRRTMEEVLFQAGLAQSDDPDMAWQAGKALGSNFVVFGRVTKSGLDIIAKIHLLDVQNRQDIKAWTFTFSGNEAIKDWAPGFARELIDTIQGEKVSASVIAAPSGPIEIENFQARNKGKIVFLSWQFDPSGPVSVFNVYRSENKSGPYRLLATINNNSYEDASIKTGRNYYYRIGILLHSGGENKSRHIAGVLNVGEKVPYPPLIISSKGHIRRAWIKFVPALQNEQDKFKIKSYVIHRQKSGENRWQTVMTVDASKKISSRPFFEIEDVSDLADGENYSYAISSVDAQGRTSPWSDQCAVKIVARPVLKLAGDELLRQVVLSWSPLENIEGYYLYRKSGAGEWKRIVKIRGASKTAYTDAKDLTDGGNYQYYLTAFDQKSETGPSQAVRVKTKNPPPCPDGITAKSGLVKSVLISWTPIEDPDVGGYLVYRGDAADRLQRIAKVKGHKSFSYLDKGSGFNLLEDGKDYYYSVVSYNLFNAEGPAAHSVKVRTKPRPMVVTGLVVTAAQQNIHIQWDKNPEPDIVYYVLYRNRNNGYWSKIERLAADRTDYNDFDLQALTTYRYKIVAVDRDRLQSDPAESDPVLSPLVDKK